MYTEVHAWEAQPALQAAFLAIRFWRIRPMAGYAVLWGRLIKQNAFRTNFLKQLVTFPALYVLVRSPQRKGSPFFVIKQRWLPLHAVVAVGAGSCLTFGELLPVRILVAVFA